MIAGVDSQTDISVCFQEGDLTAISKGKEISGILIRTSRPHEQGYIRVRHNNKRQNLNGFGIGIDDLRYWKIKKGFELKVFIGNYYFDLLKERGRIGTRHSLCDGSKITLYNLNDFDTRNMIADLEFYRDNQENFRRKAQSK